jgi:NAD-dependent SIR2 family protein deacetylase
VSGGHPVNLLAICCAVVVRLTMEVLGAAILLFGTAASAHAYEISVTNQRTNKMQIVDGTSLQVTGEVAAGLTVSHTASRSAKMRRQLMWQSCVPTKSP